MGVIHDACRPVLQLLLCKTLGKHVIDDDPDRPTPVAHMIEVTITRIMTRQHEACACAYPHPVCRHVCLLLGATNARVAVEKRRIRDKSGVLVTDYVTGTKSV